MEATTIKARIKDINFYKNKNFVSFFRSLNEEDIKNFVDIEVTTLISELENNKIGLIFRNSNALMQEMLFENERIQRVLILGIADEENIVCSEKATRNLENFGKIIKSDTLKDKIFSNDYFVTYVLNNAIFKERFFKIYDIKKVFDGIVESKMYDLLAVSEQQSVVEKLNQYTRSLLLPKDFREKFRNIDNILASTLSENIGSEILLQLNDEELFFLDFKNVDITKNLSLKKYLTQKLRDDDLSIEEFLKETKTKERKLRDKLPYYFRNVIGLEEKMFYILLHDNQDEIIKEKLLKYLICKIIPKDISYNVESFYNHLKRNLNYGLLEYSDIRNLKRNDDENDKKMKLTFYQKFNIALRDVRYLSGITVEQIEKFNVKHINKLAKFLEDKTQDEISAIYGTCIKMYFIFGYERCLEIFNKKYGEYNRKFLDNVSKCDVSHIEMIQEGSKYLPKIDKRFITFMFATPTKNHFSKMFDDKTSELYKNWYYFYNCFDEILEKCHGQLTLKKINSIFETEKYKINKNLITPDVYNLNNSDFIENIVLGNKVHKRDDEVLKNIVEIYQKMKKRIESSIPYVKGVADCGYSYEMMKFDDPTIFELGYKANCCIRVLDIAHNHLLHAALCRNGRILLIYDKLGDLAAFSPLKRNGNVLIANSIECIDKNYEYTGKMIAEAFKKAMLDIVAVSQKSTEKVNLVCIGRDAYVKPKKKPFPNEYPTPTIFEKKDKVYGGTDTYHKKLDIVYQDSNFNLGNIIVKDPAVSYMDPRDEIKHVDLNMERDRLDVVANIVNSINYTLNSSEYNPVFKYTIEEMYYNKDWYIANTCYGIISGCLDNDYRAREEFDKYMEMINGDNPKVFKR